jgi:hypothetical protein
MAVGWDRARFYKVDGKEWPSVTTILDVINKPALGPWYAKEERRHFETALLELASTHQTITGEQLLDAVINAVNGVKAADKTKQKAATIGTALHAAIEWHLRHQLGEDPGKEPTLPDESAWAFEAWKDWAKSVDLVPLMIERVVYCEYCGFAGTLDLYAKVKGALTVLDWKTGRAVYGEAFLQNAAYRHAARQRGIESEQGLIVRLPKIIGDPAPEPVWVPESSTYTDFRAAAYLWRWNRRTNGERIGSIPPGKCPLTNGVAA